MANLHLDKGGTPGAASAGAMRLFVDAADGHLKRIDESGVVTDIEGAASIAGLMVAFDSDTSTRINFDTSDPPTDVAHNFVTPTLAPGTYVIEPHITWSHDATNSDFRGNVTANAANGYPISPIHKQEPKESGGGGPGGTDQRLPGNYPAFEFVLASQGTITVEILYGTDDGDDESTIYYSSIKVFAKP